MSALKTTQYTCIVSKSDDVDVQNVKKIAHDRYSSLQGNIAQVCYQNDLKDMKLKKIQLKNIWFDYDHNIMGCLPLKVASTTWVEHFLK
jgi:hypothetical protein